MTLPKKVVIGAVEKTDLDGDRYTDISVADIWGEYNSKAEYIRKDLTFQWRPISEYDPDTMFGCVFYGRADGEARIWTHTIRKPTHLMQLTPPERTHD